MRAMQPARRLRRGSSREVTSGGWRGGDECAFVVRCWRASCFCNMLMLNEGELCGVFVISEKDVCCSSMLMVSPQNTGSRSDQRYFFSA